MVDSPIVVVHGIRVRGRGTLGRGSSPCGPYKRCIYVEIKRYTSGFRLFNRKNVYFFSNSSLAPGGPSRSPGENVSPTAAEVPEQGIPDGEMAGRT
jgi:hypothetical protein